jgi:hypothetical protein
MRSFIELRATATRAAPSSPRLGIMRRFESWWPTSLSKASRRPCRRRCGETVDAVSSLKKNEVALGELAAKLALDKSVTSRRLRDATDRGYLVNLEIRRGRPARIIPGDPMPEMVKLLPEPDELAA